MEITKVVKPLIRRGWPNTFDNIVIIENSYRLLEDIFASDLWLFYS